MDTPLRLLILENSPSDTELMLEGLRRAGFRPIVDQVLTEQDFRDRLHPAPDLILADFNRPTFAASEALTILRESGRDIPSIVVSGPVGEQQAALMVELRRRLHQPALDRRVRLPLSTLPRKQA